MCFPICFILYFHSYLMNQKLLLFYRWQKQGQNNMLHTSVHNFNRQHDICLWEYGISFSRHHSCPLFYQALDSLQTHNTLSQAYKFSNKLYQVGRDWGWLIILTAQSEARAQAWPSDNLTRPIKYLKTVFILWAMYVCWK